MLYPAELLRHAVFASRIPIYFTAWDRLCQGLSGPGRAPFLAWSIPSILRKASPALHDRLASPYPSFSLTSWLLLHPPWAGSASPPQPAPKSNSPSHTKRDQDHSPSLLIVKALCLGSCLSNGFSYQGFDFINSGALLDGFVSQGFHFLRVQLG